MTTQTTQTSSGARNSIRGRNSFRLRSRPVGRRNNNNNIGSDNSAGNSGGGGGASDNKGLIYVVNFDLSNLVAPLARSRFVPAAARALNPIVASERASARAAIGYPFAIRSGAIEPAASGARPEASGIEFGQLAGVAF